MKQEKVTLTIREDSIKMLIQFLVDTYGDILPAHSRNAILESALIAFQEDRSAGTQSNWKEVIHLPLEPVLSNTSGLNNSNLNITLDCDSYVLLRKSIIDDLNLSRLTHKYALKLLLLWYIYFLKKEHDKIIDSNDISNKLATVSKAITLGLDAHIFRNFYETSTSAYKVKVLELANKHLTIHPDIRKKIVDDYIRQFSLFSDLYRFPNNPPAIRQPVIGKILTGLILCMFEDEDLTVFISEWEKTM